MIRATIAALAAGLSVSPACAGIGLQDFYITDSAGMIYSVDAGTLQATEVVQLSGSGQFRNITDILYLGNNQIMSNVLGVISVHDLDTGVGVEQVRISDHLGGGTHYVTGLARTDGGEIYTSVESITPDGDSSYGTYWDPATNTVTQTTGFDELILYLDNHEISPGIMLGAYWSRSEIHVRDLEGGSVLNAYAVGFDPVSFFQFGDTIYTIAKEGDLYTFDPSDGSTSYVGAVTGAGTSIIGATVPAPGSLALMGIGGVAGARRRR